MSKLSNTEAALLGLLSEEPMHPYKIEQEVKHRDMRFWADLSMSSIYKLIRKLEKDGFVNREDKISPENRLQKLYSVSEAGLEALRIKLTELLEEPEHMRWQIDIAMYNRSLVQSEKVRDALTRYRAGLEKNLEGYQRLHEYLVDENCPPYRFELARRPQYLLKAEMEWVDSVLASL